MNIENKKQLAAMLLAVGLGLVAAMLMSKVVGDKVEEQTKIIAKEYQGRSAALVKELDATKQGLDKLAKDQAALAQKIAQQPTVVQQAASSKIEKPQVQQAAFSLRTPPGKRALTIKISSLSAVGGLLNPGDFVDIIAHLKVPSDEGDAKVAAEKVTTVLFQNLQVLAVGTNYDPAGEAPPPYAVQQGAGSLNVTLAVNPEEAGLLTFAQSNGEFQLSLRSPAERNDRILQQVASWDALADFVLERQGTELPFSKRKMEFDEKEDQPEPKKEEGPKPFIQIYRRGQEL